MKVIDVYAQYFAAECEFNGVARHGVSAVLTAESDAGQIQYSVTVSFFPHSDANDFCISYDACASETIYEAKGRRFKKREAAIMAEEFRPAADRLADSLGGKIFWDQPLKEARLG